MSYDAKSRRQDQLQMLQKNTPTIMFFKEIKFDNSEMKVLTDCVQSSKSHKLKTVTFDGVLDNQSLIKFAKSLETNYTLESVTISNIPDLDITGVEAITQALLKNKNIKEFKFYQNNLGSVQNGPELFAEVIKTKLNIKKLNLSLNNLNDAGVETLGKAMKSNTVITELSLEGNSNKNYLPGQGLANAICDENAQGTNFYTALSKKTHAELISKLGERAYNNIIPSHTPNNNLSLSPNTKKMV